MEREILCNLNVGVLGEENTNILENADDTNLNFFNPTTGEVSIPEGFRQTLSSDRDAAEKFNKFVDTYKLHPRGKAGIFLNCETQLKQLQSAARQAQPEIKAQEHAAVNPAPLPAQKVPAPVAVAPVVSPQPVAKGAAQHTSIRLRINNKAIQDILVKTAKDQWGENQKVVTIEVDEYANYWLTLDLDWSKINTNGNDSMDFAATAHKSIVDFLEQHDADVKGLDSHYTNLLAVLGAIGDIPDENANPSTMSFMFKTRQAPDYFLNLSKETMGNDEAQNFITIKEEYGKFWMELKIDLVDFMTSSHKADFFAGVKKAIDASLGEHSIEEMDTNTVNLYALATVYGTKDEDVQATIAADASQEIKAPATYTPVAEGIITQDEVYEKAMELAPEISDKLSRLGEGFYYDLQSSDNLQTNETDYVLHIRSENSGSNTPPVDITWEFSMVKNTGKITWAQSHSIQEFRINRFVSPDPALKEAEIVSLMLEVISDQNKEISIPTKEAMLTGLTLEGHYMDGMKAEKNGEKQEALQVYAQAAFFGHEDAAQAFIALSKGVYDDLISQSQAGNKQETLKGFIQLLNSYSKLQNVPIIQQSLSTANNIVSDSIVQAELLTDSLIKDAQTFISESNFEGAIKILRPLVDIGSPKAVYMLAGIYENQSTAINDLTAEQALGEAAALYLRYAQSVNDETAGDASVKAGILLMDHADTIEIKETNEDGSVLTPIQIKTAGIGMILSSNAASGDLQYRAIQMVQQDAEIAQMIIQNTLQGNPNITITPEQMVEFLYMECADVNPDCAAEAGYLMYEGVKPPVPPTEDSTQATITDEQLKELGLRHIKQAAEDNSARAQEILELINQQAQ